MCRHRRRRDRPNWIPAAVAVAWMMLTGGCAAETARGADDASSSSTSESGGVETDEAGETGACPGAPDCACASDEDCDDGTWCHEGACKLPVCGDDVEDPDEACQPGWAFENCHCTDACETECGMKECLPETDSPCDLIHPDTCGHAYCEGYLWDDSECFDPDPIPDAGPPGPVMEGCAVQCAGYLDSGDQPDVPDAGWADACRMDGFGRLAIVCGTLDEWRGVVVRRSILDEAGPAMFAEEIVEVLGSDEWEPTTQDLDLLGAAFDVGTLELNGSGACDGQPHASLGVHVPGCTFEITNCFGLGFDETGHENENADRSLWLYLVD